MDPQDIAYVELYTDDHKSTLDYFASSFAFAEVARSDTDEWRSTLLRQGDVWIVITSGPVAAEFLAAHGDGIADIAFGCDDVAGMRARAVSEGASPVGPAARSGAVLGVADVRHTLVPRADRAGWPRVPGRRWSQSAAPPPVSARIERLDHLAVCLEAGTLQATVTFYAAAFGFERYSSEYVELGGQAMDSVVIRSPSGEITFTLIEPVPTRAPGQLDAFLTSNGGPGVQHLAFLVEEIIPAVREYRASGVDFLPSPGGYYDALAERMAGMREDIADLRETGVLADRDEWGYLLQLFTRAPHERETLFYELVQRRGARGFGSANIRALYESVKRDRGIGG